MTHLCSFSVFLLLPLRTLEWLAADIHHDSPCHGRLLDALAEASQWTKTTCIIEALKSQATIAENRKSLVNHEIGLS